VLAGSYDPQPARPCISESKWKAQATLYPESADRIVQRANADGDGTDLGERLPPPPMAFGLHVALHHRDSHGEVQLQDGDERISGRTLVY